jgi:hypothetical protein
MFTAMIFVLAIKLVPFEVVLIDGDGLSSIYPARHVFFWAQ